VRVLHHLVREVVFGHGHDVGPIHPDVVVLAAILEVTVQVECNLL
jgi:hypothetical protein